jgi:Transposase
MARHTKLTPELHQAIVSTIAGGVPLASAARLHNVEAKTLQQWLRYGEGAQRARPAFEHYARFAEAVRQAEAMDEAKRVLRISQAAQGGQLLYERTTTAPDGRVTTERRYQAPQWTADMTHLERTRPDIWARKTEVDLRIRRDQIAEKVAAETGLSVAEVLAEAERMLKE